MYACKRPRLPLPPGWAPAPNEIPHGPADPRAAGGGCELACAPEAEARVYGDVRAAADALPEHRVRCPITVPAGAGAGGAFERAAPLIARRLPCARFERCDLPQGALAAWRAWWCMAGCRTGMP